ncbi:MAG TPA: hypothetical protein PK657_13990, partial [Legionella sp.]|nr:hypothetical protein [Legionella sp.]
GISQGAIFANYYPFLNNQFNGAYKPTIIKSRPPSLNFIIASRPLPSPTSGRRAGDEGFGISQGAIFANYYPF